MVSATAPCNVCTDFKSMHKKVAQSSSSSSLPCPPDASSLGSSTWTFLHTLAAYYPSDPTPQEQQLMSHFLQGLAQFYPCSYCASHLRQDLSEFPPSLQSNTLLSQWFCQMHNRVNQRLGKPTFDCSRVFERWKEGREDCIPPAENPF